MKADTKLTVVMCSQIFDRKTTAPSSGDFCRLADSDYDSWSPRKSLTFKTSDIIYIFKKIYIYLLSEGLKIRLFFRLQGSQSKSASRQKSPLDGAVDFLQAVLCQLSFQFSSGITQASINVFQWGLNRINYFQSFHVMTLYSELVQVKNHVC